MEPWYAAMKIDLKSINWRDFVLLTIGSLISAVSVSLFLVPAKIAPGGLSGIAIIIREFVDLPVGAMTLVMNIPLLILGFRTLGRFDFLKRTLYVVVIYSLSVDIFALWMPPGGITDDLLLNSLYAGVLGGLGNGIIFRGRGTAAGTSVLGRYLQLKTGIPISQVYLMTDGFVVLIAGFLLGWDRALYALITLFIWGVASDQVLEGPSVIRTVFVITDSPEAVARGFFEKLGYGLTAWAARGVFTEHEHTILFCSISRPDVSAVLEVVTQSDPNAFVVIGQGHQAIGGVRPHSLLRKASQPSIKDSTE